MSESEQPILEVRDLRQFFPIQEGLLRRVIGYVKAVNGVSFTINQGETWVWWEKADAASRPWGALFCDFMNRREVR